jgi:hypothetical protein
MKDSRAFPITLALILTVFPSATSAQNHVKRNAVVSLPTDRSETIPSPDGRWALIAGPMSDRTIHLEDRSNHKQTLVKEYSRSVQIGWSPDSRAFFLNDAYGSNLEDAFIYGIDTREPLALNNAILSSDKEAAKFPADHAYFQVGRWLSAHQVLVEYCGHGGETPARQFDFVYQVSFAGIQASKLRIHRISRTVKPLTSSAPDCSF